MSIENFAWKIGTTWTATGYVTDEGVPVDITGATIEMRIASPTARIALLSTTDGEITITDGPGGVYKISTQPANAKQNVAAGTYDYEIDVVTLDGGVSDPVSGKLTLKKSLRVLWP
jgi:hypothetical protein